MRKPVKLLSILLALSTAACLAAGCSGEETPAPEETPSGETENEAVYTPGTYTAAAQGNNDLITVEVTFSEDAITGVTVTDHKETAGIADPALEQIPTAIVENQSLGIDTIAGCTVTSNAILAAVADAVTQAGGDAEALKNKTVETVAGDPIEKTVDVVVIGGGGAGITAATAAAEAGSSVLILEKTAALGGNTLASGLALNAADPELQGQIDTMTGQLDTLRAVLEYDEAEYGEFADTLATLKEQINTYLAGDTSKMFDSVEWHIIQTYTEGKRTDIDGNVVQGRYDLISTLCTNALDAFHWLSETTGVPESDTITSPVGSMWMRGHNYQNKLDVFTYPAEYIEDKGGEIMLNTKAEELILAEDGRVTGVKATMTDGTPVTVHASKGVIIATGGFGANPEMVREYNTYWPAIPEDIKTTCVASATGDGIALGQQAGANLVDMGLTQLMPTAGAFTGSLTDGLLVAPQNYLFVNKEGRRFVNEYAARDTLAFAALEQTDGMFFTIADQEMAKTVQNGATQEDIDAMVNKGLIYKADTLAELAEQIGCEASVLEETVAYYNTCVDNGSDPEFGKNVFEMKVETAPFYACPSKPAVHHTMGGLEINAQAQVINEAGEAIPGLYAAGEVTGGIHAGNRLGGNAIADCFVFGRIAGQNAAQA